MLALFQHDLQMKGHLSAHQQLVGAVSTVLLLLTCNF
jgi:hypothetical protein